MSSIQQSGTDRASRDTNTCRSYTANFEELTGSRLSEDVLLNDLEITFLKSASDGHVDQIRSAIEKHNYYLSPLNVNCTDSLDRQALTLAILNGHLSVVEFLLFDELLEDVNLTMGHALFHAIDCEFYCAIELLLEKDPQTDLQVIPGTTSNFSPGLTPFMLAAHKNNYKILSLLYKYEHRLQPLSGEVGEKTKLLWNTVMERLLHYEARASPAYMLLMYSEKGLHCDPMMEAIELHGELISMAKIESEVSERYLAAANTCEQFALDVLQNVRSSNELSGLMRFDLDEESEDDRHGHSSDQSYNTEKSYLKIISKACKSKMLDFVTSDNAQLAVVYIYRGRMFRNYTGYRGALLKILLGFLFPILSIAQLLFPQARLGKLSRNPTVKYWCHLISEIVFIVILVLNTVITGRNELIPKLLIVAYVWILGKLVQEVREMTRGNTYTEYFYSPWNWNDLACIICFSAYMSLRIHYKLFLQPKSFIDRFHEKDYTVYWYEHDHHILLYSDMCIAAVYVFVFLRIMELLRTSRFFGPLQLSLERMAIDACLFIILYGIFFFAFATSLTQLYAPYGAGKGCACNDIRQCQMNLTKSTQNPSIKPNITAHCHPILCKEETSGQLAFTNLTGTLSELFWTLFGYGTATEGQLSFQCSEKANIKLFGNVLLGSYHFAGLIVLINMLIAMMSNSFQRTADDAERQWKFYRTLLWLQYIHNDLNRPPPMNLIPNVVKIYYYMRSEVREFMRWIKKKPQNKSKPKEIDERVVASVNQTYESSVKQCSVTKQERHTDKADIESAKKTDAPSSSIRCSRRKPCGPLWSVSVQSERNWNKYDIRYAKVLRLVVIRYIKKQVLQHEVVQRREQLEDEDGCSN